jgi:hypothetical protein
MERLHAIEHIGIKIHFLTHLPQRVLDCIVFGQPPTLSQNGSTGSWESSLTAHIQLYPNGAEFFNPSSSQD